MRLYVSIYVRIDCIWRVTGTLLMANYFSDLSKDPFQRGCCRSSAQSCLTLCNPMDCSLRGSSVHGILPFTKFSQYILHLNLLTWEPRGENQQPNKYSDSYYYYAQLYAMYSVSFKMTKTVPIIELNKHWLSILNPNWRRKWQPTQVFLLGESQGQRSLVGCRLQGRTESGTTEAT